MIKITNVSVTLKENHPGIYGTASIVIHDAICIRGLRIVKGKKGAFIGMPCHWLDDGQPVDFCFPLNQEARDYITETVMEAFRKEYPEIAANIKMYSA